MGLVQSETEAAVKAEFASKVGEEDKKGGDKKEGDKKGDASAETKVPEAPELKGDTKTSSSQEKGAAPTKATPVDIQFSEMKFAQNDGENYKKFSKDKEALTEDYAKKQASTYGRKEPNQIDYEIAGMKAKKDTIIKYRKEIEASGAGKVTGGEPPVASATEPTTTPPTAPTSKTDTALAPSQEKSAAAPTKASKVDIQFSEMKFAQNDQENYKKFSKDKEALTEDYAKKQASTYGRKEPNQIDYEIAGMKAKKDTILKYRKEIEASGAGKVTGGELTPSAKSESAQLTPAQPTTGERMTKQSNENNMAKTEAMTGGNNSNTSIVSAPKITNSTSVTNAPINVRNNENTFVRNQDKVSAF
jgi:hypothetical protein